MKKQPDDLRELYRELILDHARSPRHFGRLDNPTHEAAGINPLCGDKLRLYLQVDADGCIEDTSFEGTGCAICRLRLVADGHDHRAARRQGRSVL